MKFKHLNEVWIGYTVFEDGTVFKDGKDTPMQPYRKDNGYLCVCLRDTLGIRHHMLVHRLVASLFIPNPDKKTEVDHKDGNKENNHATNLQWVTHQENHVLFRQRQREAGDCTTPEQRQALERFQAGESISAIAKSWEVSTNAVGGLLRRAYKNLGLEWKDQRRK